MSDELIVEGAHALNDLAKDLDTDVGMKTLSWRVVQDVVQHLALDVLTYQEKLLWSVDGIVELHDVEVALSEHIFGRRSLCVAQLTEQSDLSRYTLLDLCVGVKLILVVDLDSYLEASLFVSGKLHRGIVTLSKIGA